MAATVRPVAAMPPISDLASILFASSVQQEQYPAVSEIRRAVIRRYYACERDCSAYIAEVAQEAANHSDRYVRRMDWALAAVHEAFAGLG